MIQVQESAQPQRSVPSARYRNQGRIRPPHTSAGSVRCQPDQVPETRQEYFKPGFTVISNVALEDSTLSLNNSQNRAFQYIQRFTTGYRKEWFQLKIRSACKWLGDMPPSTFYQALNHLIKLGLIHRKKDYDAQVWIRISPKFQPLKPDYIATLWTPFPNTPPSVLSELSDKMSENSDTCSEISERTPLRNQPHNSGPNGTSPSNTLASIEKQLENNDRQHQPPSPTNVTLSENVTRGGVVAPVAVALLNEPGCQSASYSQELPPLPSNHEGESSSRLCQAELSPIKKAGSQVKDVPPPARQSATDLGDRRERVTKAPRKADQGKPKLIQPSPERRQLAERLTTLGVAAPKAERLAATNSAATIERAIEALQAVYDVQNPGGWLWEALSSGRYAQEPVIASKTDAEQVRERENAERLRRDNYQSALSRTSAERERQLNERRQRDAERDASHRQSLNAETDRQKLAVFAALSDDQLADLRTRALASFRGQMPEPVIIGQMVYLAEADQRSKTMRC